jgi:hypothetical protein
MNAIFQSVILKWLLRRVLELGPIASGALSWWNSLSPADHDNLLNILQGNWGVVTLAGGVSLLGYAWSFISTVTPHATAHGVQVPTSQMTPAKKEAVKEAVATTAAKKRPTILDAIFKRQ